MTSLNPLEFGADLISQQTRGERLRGLAAELVALQPKRDPGLHYCTAYNEDIGADVLVGFEYDPGTPGHDASVDVAEVWLGGADIAPALIQSVIDALAAQAMDQMIPQAGAEFSWVDGALVHDSEL